MAKPLLNVHEAAAILERLTDSPSLRDAFIADAERMLAGRVSHTDEDDKFEVGSGFGHHSKRGHVNFRTGTAEHQLTPAKAREIAFMLLGAAEAAISDELVMTLFREKVGITDSNRLGLILLDMREIRQGSRETVWFGGQ